MTINVNLSLTTVIQATADHYQFDVYEGMKLFVILLGVPPFGNGTKWKAT